MLPVPLGPKEVTASGAEVDEALFPDIPPHRRRHVVISTSTSSGKSLAFNIPVLSAILQPSPHPPFTDSPYVTGDAVALYIFPTKVRLRYNVRVWDANCAQRGLKQCKASGSTSRPAVHQMVFYAALRIE